MPMTFDDIVLIIKYGLYIVLVLVIVGFYTALKIKNAEITSLNSKLQVASDQINKWSSDYTTLKTQTDACNAQVQVIKAQSDTLTQQIQDAESKIQALESQQQVIINSPSSPPAGDNAAADLGWLLKDLQSITSSPTHSKVR